MTEAPWTIAQIPDLTGRRALVTGVTSGLGEVTARELARAGAEVIAAARGPAKLKATILAIRRELPDATLVPVRLDLADLGSIRRGAAEAAEGGPVHILVNNAGVMATPYARTADGFELQLGTNHLGHFALTGLLFDQLVAGSARVVTVSSLLARTVRSVSLADPREEHGRYRRWKAYGESKLANLLFTFELDRRAQAQGLAVTAVAAHPGYTHTNLVHAGMNMKRATIDGAIGVAVTALLAQSVEEGSAASLRAAVEPGLPGGSYVGPCGPFEVRGAPRVMRLPRPAQDPALATRLWSLSEKATGVRFA